MSQRRTAPVLGQPAWMARARRTVGSLNIVWRSFFSWVALAAALTIVLGFCRVRLPWSWFVAINLTTFAAFAWDKLLAQSWGKKLGAMRTPEAALHLLSFAGGGIGAVTAVRALHHKTAKRSFQWGMALAITAHVVVLVVLRQVFHWQLP